MSNEATSQVEANEVSTEEEVEIEIQLNDKGIPVYMDEDGAVIKGLPKNLFLKSEDIAIKDRPDAKRAWFLYNIELKKLKKAEFQRRMEAIDETIADLQEKHDNVGVVKTEAEIAEARLLSTKRALENAMKQAEELGIDVSVLFGNNEEEEEG